MYCRNNENMCGNSGFLYEEINNNEEPINEDINNDVKVNSDNIVNAANYCIGKHEIILHSLM